MFTSTVELHLQLICATLIILVYILTDKTDYGVETKNISTLVYHNCICRRRLGRLILLNKV